MLVFLFLSSFLSIHSSNISLIHQANGCGPVYFNIDEFLRNIGEEIFIECCNKHDRCYDTCGKQQFICDTTFLHCMIEVCEQLSDISRCQRDARILFWLVVFAGQSAYQQAQQHNRCFDNRTKTNFSEK